MSRAIDRSGQRYGELATAFSYRKATVKDCSCKPPPWSRAEQARHAGYETEAAAELEREAAVLASEESGKTAASSSIGTGASIDAATEARAEIGSEASAPRRWEAAEATATSAAAPDAVGPIAAAEAVSRAGIPLHDAGRLLAFLGKPLQERAEDAGGDESPGAAEDANPARAAGSHGTTAAPFGSVGRRPPTEPVTPAEPATSSPAPVAVDESNAQKPTLAHRGQPTTTAHGFTRTPGPRHRMLVRRTRHGNAEASRPTMSRVPRIPRQQARAMAKKSRTAKQSTMVWPGDRQARMR